MKLFAYLNSKYLIATLRPELTFLLILYYYSYNSMYSKHQNIPEKILVFFLRDFLTRGCYLSDQHLFLMHCDCQDQMNTKLDLIGISIYLRVMLQKGFVKWTYTVAILSMSLVNSSFRSILSESFILEIEQRIIKQIIMKLMGFV